MKKGGKKVQTPDTTRRAWPAVIALLVLIFYWAPLMAPSAGIQWDAADLHYPQQKYFSDNIRSAHLPFWTPYVYSGYPFLANPESGAWYLPHWPSFLLGITPRVIQCELALHALLACLGSYLLFGRLIRNRAAAAAGALCFGLSGFFAGHSSHVGLFASAALLPWLLLAFRDAMDKAPVRSAVWGGLVGGSMIMIGYVQAAIYAYLAVGLWGLAEIWRTPRRWLRITAVIAGMLGFGLALAAIHILPGLELAAYSQRSVLEYSRSTEGVLHVKALATLAAPDALGSISGPYRGPADVTQYYFYAGILLLPLAMLGALKTNLRLAGLALVLPAAWYMLGPAAGLYRLGALAPGLQKLRAPVQGWFIVALGLALLAAAGLGWILDRWRVPYLGVVILALIFADLWYWNVWTNPLAWSRAGFEATYGPGREISSRIARSMAPLTRFEAPARLGTLGPLNEPLNARIESTYGYFALEPVAYSEYLNLVPQNPRLRDALNVSRYLDSRRNGAVPNPTALTRAWFPKAVADVSSPHQSRDMLGTLNPAAKSVVQTPHAPVQQDPSAWASVESATDEAYRIRYRAASPSLLVISVPYFPGWRATVAGRELPVLRANHALMGVVAPPGEQLLELRYRSTYFRAGALITLGSLFGACLVLLRARGR